MEHICENCKHWKQRETLVPGPICDYDHMIGLATWGHCQESPPTRNWMGATKHPVTHCRDLCGHFEPNDQADL